LTSLEARVERERVLALYRQGPLASLIALVIGAIIVAAMWRSVPQSWLWTWYALVIANQAVRILLWRAFHRENPQGDRVRTWARRYTWGMGIGGMLFGSTAVFMFPLASPLGQAFVTIMVSGMAAGSVPANAYHRPAMLAYLLAILSPMAVVLAWLAFQLDAREYGLLAFAYVFYVLVLLGFGRNQAELLTKTIEFSHRNDDLVEELREQTEQAEAAKRKAEQASLAKSQFFAAASHDLRQPLQALGLYTSTLRDALRDEASNQTVNQILTSVDALESLFDNLLDISKLDAGYVHANAAHFPAQALFDRLAVIYDPIARESALKLSFAPADAVLHSDPVLLERVLGNLIANAIRYTDAGQVAVRCAGDRTRVRIEVEDSGIGIPQAEHERIFEEFYQVGNPERDRRKGLGLGLATVRRITQLLGVPISLKSEPGRGSTFRIEVPAGDREQVTAIEPSLDAAKVNTLAGARIAVIEDDASVRDAMVKLLESWQCRVVAAASAGDATARLESTPQVVVADYRLREHETGIAAILALRHHFGSPVPGILVTGDSAPEIFTSALAHQFPVLTKPVRATQLRAALTAFVAPRRADRASDPASPAGA